ncbi:TPA: inovirus-type Gp2 protein [Morganella morganii]
MLLEQCVISRNMNGRYHLIHSQDYTFNGLSYRLLYDPLKRNNSPIRKEIINAFIKQLRAMQSLYKKSFAFRFDLSVPEGMSISESNMLIRQLFHGLRKQFKKKTWNNQPIKNWAYGWVCEKEKAKQVHYHCWIALPYFQVRTAGFGESGMIGLISNLWKRLTSDVSRVHLAGGRYILKQDDHSSLVNLVERISYLAKDRGKFSSGEGQRIFSTSKL